MLICENICTVIIMKEESIRLLLTKEQKDFLKNLSKQEQRTMTSIINISIKNKYSKYPLE